MDSEKVFNKISLDFSRFQKPAKKLTEEQVLATEVYEYFSKELSFGRIMKMIKYNGIQCAREVFEETKKSDAKDELAIFVWSIKKNKTIWI